MMKMMKFTAFIISLEGASAIRSQPLVPNFGDDIP